MFSSNISPVTTPTPRVDSVLKYSRHSGDNLQTRLESENENPVAETGGCKDEDRRRFDFGGALVSTPKGGLDQQLVGSGTRDADPVSPKTAAKFRLDQVITEHASKLADVSSFNQDRELEFENADTDTESSQTEGSTSALEDKRYCVCSQVNLVVCDVR